MGAARVDGLPIDCHRRVSRAGECNNNGPKRGPRGGPRHTAIPWKKEEEEEEEEERRRRGEKKAKGMPGT